MRRAHLQAARKAANLTQEQVAERVGVDRTTIGNWERGDFTPAPGEERARYAEALGITLSELHAALSNLPLEDNDEVPTWLSTYLAREQAAREFRGHQPHVIAGLLQTQDYAAAIARSVGTTPTSDEYVQRTKDLRLLRQQRILNGDLQFATIQPEFPFHMMMGSPEVMADQLDQVLEWAQLDNVTVQVVPYDRGQYEALRIGTFSLLSFPWSATPSVHLELGGNLGARSLDAADDVSYFADALDHASSKMAMAPQASLDYLRKMADEWRSRV